MTRMLRERREAEERAEIERQYPLGGDEPEEAFRRRMPHFGQHRPDRRVAWRLPEGRHDAAYAVRAANYGPTQDPVELPLQNAWARAGEDMEDERLQQAWAVAGDDLEEDMRHRARRLTPELLECVNLVKLYVLWCREHMAHVGINSRTGQVAGCYAGVCMGVEERLEAVLRVVEAMLETREDRVSFEDTIEALKMFRVHVFEDGTRGSQFFFELFNGNRWSRAQLSHPSVVALQMSAPPMCFPAQVHERFR